MTHDIYDEKSQKYTGTFDSEETAGTTSREKTRFPKRSVVNNDIYTPTRGALADSIVNNWYSQSQGQQGANFFSPTRALFRIQSRGNEQRSNTGLLS